MEKLQPHSDGQYRGVGRQLWFPYPVLKVPVPSIQREMMVALVDLTDITHTVLNFVLPSLNEDNVQQELGDAMRIYETMQAWQEGLPESLEPEFGDVAHVYLLQ